MIIEPYQEYKIIALGKDNLKYEWNIYTRLESRAWKLVGANIRKGSLLNDGEYKVIHIEKISKHPVLLKIIGQEIKQQRTPDISTPRCTTCFGKLVIDCRMCGGSGYDCKRCNGTGKTYCVACRGGKEEVEGYTIYNFPSY